MMIVCIQMYKYQRLDLTVGLYNMSSLSHTSHVHVVGLHDVWPDDINVGM